MSKIFISVHGGIVQDIWSTNKKDVVEVQDWDNLEDESWDVQVETEDAFYKKMKKYHHIY